MVEKSQSIEPAAHLAYPASTQAKEWQVVVVGAMIVAVSYGWGRYNYGLFLPEFKNEFSLSPYWLGLIGSLSYSGYLLATLLSSLFAALLGPRVLIVVGGVCASLGLFLVAQAQDVMTLTLGLAIAGVSPGLCYTPLSDVSVRVYPPERQGRAYAWMNTGTSWGVILAGPVALWMGDQWREAWLVFAGLTLLVTLANAWVMPGRTTTAHSPMAQGMPPFNWLFNRRRVRLYAFAFGVGLVCSIYWTFAVDMIVEVNPSGSMLGMPTQEGTRVFWIVLGVAGCFGAVTGDLVQRFGLRNTQYALTLLVALSLALLAQGASSTAWTLSSAVLFGGGFVAVTAVVGLWAVRSFYERPSAGFGIAFLMISLGQLIGPFMAGWLAEGHGLVTLFNIGALLTALLLLLGARAHSQP